ncbi:MAG: hypothetical protein ACR2PO_16870, partial [Methyloligellaceae bacterium]
MTGRSKKLGVFLGVSVALLTMGAMMGPASAAAGAEPLAAVLQSYLRAMYARDAEAAYRLISTADKAEKSLDDYRAETGGFAGSALALTKALAAAIRFENATINTDGDRANVTFDAVLPDANSPELEGIVQGFDRERLSRLTAAETAGRLARIREL